MNWKDPKTEKLYSNLVELKLIFEFPKEYLTHHFKGLKNRVDASALSLLSVYNTNKIIVDKINDCWEAIINRIRQFELECLRYSASLINNNNNNNNQTNLAEESSSMTAQRIRSIETKLNYLTEQSSMMSIAHVEQMLNDELFKLERIVFQNKSLLYLDNKNGLEYMRDLPQYFIGKLVCISNEYFRQDRLDLFFNENNLKHYLNRKAISNDLLKTWYLAEQIKYSRFKSTNPVDEIAFNCNVNTFYNLLVDKSIDSIWLESTAFKDFSRLTELNLSRNKLKSLNSKLFQDLISLTKIDLSYNQLQSIDSRLFKGLTCLTHIWLNNNQLSTINTKLFKGLNNLTHIWLNDNIWLSDNLELYIESSLEFISYCRGFNENDIDFVTILKMNWRDLKVDEMYKELDELKFVADYPREFLLAYFKNLKQRIETSLSCSFSSCSSTAATHRSVVTSPSSSSSSSSASVSASSLSRSSLYFQRDTQFDRIKLFELECLSSVAQYSKQIVSLENICAIQMKLDSLSRNYFLNDNFKEQVKEIECSIYDELYRLQKYLFRGKTLICLEKKMNYSDECFTCYEKKMKLVLVNEFFGKRGLEIISQYDNETYKFPINDLQGYKMSFVIEIYKAWHLKNLIVEEDLVNRKPTSSPSALAQDVLSIDLKMDTIQLSKQNLKMSINKMRLNEIFDLSVILIDNNEMSLLSPFLFQGLTNLTHIGLDNNELLALDSKIFQGLNSLTRIDLQMNKLTNLHPDLFTGLNKLSRIDLHGNRLTSVDQLFRGLTNLTILDLSNNKIQSLDGKAFEGCTKLNDLLLSNNKIASILDPKTFNSLINLKRISLSNNRITALNCNLFQGLASLNEIYLSNNKMDSVCPIIFENLVSLNVLLLDENGLKSIDHLMFKGLTSLNKIGLANNKLNSIDYRLFNGLVNLTHIYLNENQINHLDANLFSGLNKLTEINLAQNQLQTLNSKLFQDLISLTKIDLSYNQLQSIDPRLFKGLSCLTHIWLNNNQLSTINTKLFKGLNNLTHIWLNDNNWLSDNLELYIESSLEFISFKKDINDINYEEVSSLPLMQQPPLSHSSSLDTSIKSTSSTMSLCSLKKISTEMDDLHKQIDELRIMFLFPVEFLTNHFKSIKSKIDSAAINLLTTCYNYRNQLKINESWELMCSRLKAYEKECINNCMLNLTDSLCDDITDKIKEIELKLNILSIEYSFKCAKELEQLITDETNRLQKFFFMNKSFIFVEKKSNSQNSLKAQLDLSTYFGKLICISNEYFGKTGTEYIVKKLTSSSRQLRTSISNELIKTMFLMEVMSPQQLFTSSPYDEVSINLNELNSIDLSYQELTSLSKNCFIGLTNLKSIDLSENELTLIDSSAFNGLYNLVQIDLSCNKLITLDSKLFKGLTNLMELHLNDNKLITIDSALFKDLINLNHISLFNNQIEYFNSQLFQNCAKLTQIYLNDNKFTSIDPRLFAGLTNLTEIGLLNNNLVYIDQKLFNGLTNLTEIGLFNTQLTQVDPMLFHGLISLNKIGLGANYLTQIDANLFTGLKNLTEIYLNDNQIESLDSNLFKGLHSLTEIGLWNNKISWISPNTFDGLTKLAKIWLSKNKLKNLDSKLFRGLTSLTKIGLGINQLTSIDRNLFHMLKNLTFINLSENELTSIPRDTFKGLVNLTEIWLWNNQLTFISPGLFEGLVKLTHIDLSGNLLTNLNSNLFNRLFNLTHISLDNNRLNTIDAKLFQGLFNLSTIKLHHNKQISCSDRLELFIEKNVKFVSFKRGKDDNDIHFVVSQVT